MRILIHKEIQDDLRLCKRKHWYNGLDEELPKICRLLRADGFLPGEEPIEYLGKELGNKVWHARVILPKENLGKRKGARIVYFKENTGIIRILYIGGHNDSRYDNSHKLVDLIKNRNIGEFTEWND